MKNSLSRKKNLSAIITFAILATGLILVIIPFMYMITISLTPKTFVMPYPPRLLPEKFYVQNYITVWESNHFGQYFFNSLYVSLITTIASLFISAISAYGFSKFEFCGKNIIFQLFLFSMMVPGILNIIPQYTLTSRIGLVDTHIGLILLYVGTGIAGNTFFLKSFFDTIPHEFEEAILIDGGNRWVVFRHIILPLSAPSIGTFSIFAFTGAWDEFFGALTLIKTQSKRTLPIAIRLFEGQHATDYSLIFAASIIAVAPIILIFIIFQKQLVKGGIAEGGIKG